MNNFKHFQRTPIFDTKEGMSLEKKQEALNMADEIVRQVEERCRAPIDKDGKLNSKCSLWK